MLAKLFGFLMALSLFVLIFYSLASQTLFENAFYIIALLGFNLLVLALSRLTKSSLVNGVQEGIKAFGQTVSKIVVGFSLVLVYVLGVGPVWLLSRLTSKRFIDLNPDKASTWIRNEKKSDLEEMF